jgi:hypothetical protein
MRFSVASPEWSNEIARTAALKILSSEMAAAGLKSASTAIGRDGDINAARSAQTSQRARRWRANDVLWVGHLRTPPHHGLSNVYRVARQSPVGLSQGTLGALNTGTLNDAKLQRNIPGGVLARSFVILPRDKRWANG